MPPLHDREDAELNEEEEWLVNNHKQTRSQRRGERPWESAQVASGVSVVLGMITTAFSTDSTNDSSTSSEEDEEEIYITSGIRAWEDDDVERKEMRGRDHQHTLAPESMKSCSVLFVMLLLLIYASVPKADGGKSDLSRYGLRISIRDEALGTRNNVLIVGGAGFVGMHTATTFHSMGSTVIAYDNFNGDYYSPALKEKRASILGGKGIQIVRGDACDKRLLNQTMVEHQIDRVVYLAAQSVTRDDGAVKRPFQYPLDNMDCFVTMLDVLKSVPSIPLVYASSASGFRYDMTVDHATANDEVEDPTPDYGIRSNEMIARAYYKLYGLSSVGLRLPTVVGPWGRPDMTPFQFVNKVASGEVVQLYKYSRNPRSFISVEDVVNSIVSKLQTISDGSEFVTVSRSCSTSDEELLNLISESTGKEAKLEIADEDFFAFEDGSTNFKSSPCQDAKEDMTPTHEAVASFVEWFNDMSFESPLLNSTAQSEIKKKRNKRESTHICFVTAMFSANPKMVDKEGPYPVDQYKHTSSSYRYYYFTNVPNLPSNGWQQIIIDDFPFRRLITQSRWPKFMGFQHHKLRHCRTIIYSDSERPPKDVHQDIWEGMARRVYTAKSGIMQNARPGHDSVIEELDSLLPRRKDIPANVEASKKWLLQQTDFDDNARAWWNMVLIIDPTNERYRELMTTFWAHYSAEEQSWRDQPLYRYIVDKLQIHPVVLYQSHDDFFHKIKGAEKLHHYNATDDGRQSKRILTN